MLVTGNLLWYMCAKNHQIRAWFDKVIAKIKWCSFFYSHGILRRSIFKHDKIVEIVAILRLQFSLNPTNSDTFCGVLVYL